MNLGYKNVNSIIFKSFLIILLIPILFGILSGCSPKSLNDCGYQQNIYGQRVSWKTKDPIPVYINPSVPVALRPAIYRAALTWQKFAGRKIFQILEDLNSVARTPAKDKKNAIYFLTEWESDRTSEQGRTSVYWASDEIQEADIRINGADFVYYDQDPKQLVKMNPQLKTNEAYNFEALVLHELGHFLGLKHRDGNGTVMATHLSSFSNRVNLASSDASAVQCEY